MFLLIIILIFSLVSIAKIGDELKSITEEDLPLMENVILVTEYQLEQAVHFERSLRFGEIMAHDPGVARQLKNEINSFYTLGKLVGEKIRKSKKHVEISLKAISSAKVKKKFAYIKEALENIEKAHSDFEQHAQRIFGMLSSEGLTDEVEEFIERVEHEEEQLDKEIKTLLQELGKFTRYASLTAEKHEKTAFMILISLGLISLIVIILSIWYLRKMMRKTIPSILSKIEYLATYDSLTGLLNRQTFLTNATKFLLLAKREKKIFSILMIDLDYFKIINDQYGHAAGDEVLKSFAKTIRNVLRESDFISRYGGEEFAILLPNLDADTALPFTERLHTAIRESVIKYNHALISYTVSMGLTSFSLEDTENIKQLLEQADKALYFAKENGRNCTAIFEANQIRMCL